MSNQKSKFSSKWTVHMTVIVEIDSKDSDTAKQTAKDSIAKYQDDNDALVIIEHASEQI